jgi:hypothetical protein
VRDTPDVGTLDGDGVRIVTHRVPPWVVVWKMGQRISVMWLVSSVVSRRPPR